MKIIIAQRMNLSKTEQLDNLSHEAGIVYTQALVIFKRILRKKNIWLSKNSMQRIINNKNLHSQTTQGIVENLYDNINAWRQKYKNDKRARLPKKRKWFFIIIYKESAIKLRDNILTLSNGIGINKKFNKTIEIPWKFEKPKMIKISFNKNKMCYQLNAIYNTVKLENNNTEVAGIDLGEIHIAVVNTGAKTYIINGRELRSKRRYQNKIKSELQKQISKKKKGSKRYKKLINKKNKNLNKLKNQINDICQKQTTKLMSLLNDDKVKTVGIGDLTNIRDNINYGKKVNQKLHQWNFSEVTFMITYKAEKLGMEVKKVSERYTTQTCPICLKRHKSYDRNYICSCGFKYHRDGVGAINIRSMTMYQGLVPVVGVMASPIGIRYS